MPPAHTTLLARLATADRGPRGQRSIVSSHRRRALASLCLAVVFALVSVAAVRPLDGVQSLPSAVRWSVAISARPAAPPVFAGERVVVVLQSGTVAAHRVADGSEVWHVELRSDYPAAAEGNRVFVVSGEAIHALNAENASVLWRAPAGTLTAPLVVHQGWIIAASAAGLAAFRAADGAKVWSRDVGTQHQRPTIEGDHLYVPLDDGRLLALDLRSGTERWARRFAGVPSEVLALADRIYFGTADKNVYCLNAATGEFVWHWRTGAVVRGRPAGDASRVFVSSMDNIVRAFDRRSGALLWHPSVPFRPTTGPVVVGEAVVAPGNSAELRAFDAATGKPAGQITLGDPLAVPPAFGESGGVILMAAITGSLTGEWKLVLAGPAPIGVAIVPLTELPGTTVPIETAVPKR